MNDYINPYSLPRVEHRRVQACDISSAHGDWMEHSGIISARLVLNPPSDL